ncbi:MAG: aldose 1-epimerase [Actinomycetota bacterium]|nr:aldose 1-epimerase [Actinomycetota bacterium]
MSYATEQVLFQGYPAQALSARDTEVEAIFTPQIGMLGCSLTHAGVELLGHRGGLARYEATGSTMGIPLLHPWANRLGGFSYTVGERTVEIDPDSPRIRTDPNGLPIHGLVNASPYWEVLGTAADETSARLSARLDFAAHPELLEAFPFPHTLQIDASLQQATLTVRTTLAAAGQPVPVSFGYHPYLVLPDVPRAEWQVEIPLTRRLVLDDRMVPTGQVEEVEPFAGPLGERTFDDGYEGATDGTRFTLAGGGRTLSLELVDGYRFAQVYAPEGEEVICFEPMTAPTNALVSGRDLELVAPGETRSATFAISVA